MTTSERTIIPDTVKTKVVQHRTPSLSGFERRRGVSVGQTADGREFVQLGTVAQVSLDLETGDSIIFHRPTTPNDLFRRSNDFMPHHLIEGLVEEKGIDRIRTSVTQGGDLIEGEYALLTAPGKSIETVPGRRAVWAPLDLALGEDWHVVEE